MEKFNYKKWILEHKKTITEKVKPGSEEQDKLPDGRTITRYTAVSPKGKETPMISYDDNLEGPGDNKDLNPPIEKSDEKIGGEIKPIFIVGVPRCGSTLVERIIGSGKKTIPIGEETTIVGHFIPSKVLEKQSLKLGNVMEGLF